MKKIFKTILILVILGIIVYAAMHILKSYKPQEQQIVFKSESVVRQNIIRSIAATGTVEPEELVNVGAQVNGKIMSFGKDSEGKTIDFGSKVKTGMVLAQIDDVTYKAELQEVQASKQKAEASIKSSEANIEQTNAKLKLATANWERAQTLYNQKAMTKTDYDSYEADYYSAKANCATAAASLAEAKASLTSAEASLTRAQRNLEYCVITSPMDGVVIDRRVSIGQTVVSNQSASSIFLVAKDFSKMQVWVSVNEADIGVIKPGMDVAFSCDAFPGTEFRGKVFRLRLNATLSSNVVTYIVEVNVDNTTGLLVPYLTANVKFIRDERKNALSVSNAAIRFNPDPTFINPAIQVPTPAADEAILWKENATGTLDPVLVKVGLNNGITAEILSGDIKEGDSIVTGAEVAFANEASIGSGDAANPFLPKMPKMTGRGSAGQRERAAERAQQSGSAGMPPAGGAGGPGAGGRPQGGPR